MGRCRSSAVRALRLFDFSRRFSALSISFYSLMLFLSYGSAGAVGCEFCFGVFRVFVIWVFVNGS